ncbi:MFS transporter [Heyndrickxia acidicola]|uniref:MFS transporter n=1 Tax=Heyndrickxia acidicola TaxID=209389 RepID=A0ABU6MID4_9BACI|nr:MFS transporter [Heyndrickxia acidicola]MED1204204.1 MFS transporter [Heyndrickxia acidicola]
MSIPKARWYRIGLLLFLTYLVAFVDRSNIGMAAPIMVKSLGLSATTTGVLLSSFFWGYVITQIPSGLLASKYSAKTIIVASLFFLGLTGILTGIVKSYDMLLTVRFIMGLAEGVLWPAFAVYFINWYASHERARAINFSEMSLPISSIIMAPLAGWMIENWNYHVMFILQGSLPIILAFFFMGFASDSPEKDRFISKEEREYIQKNRYTGVKENGSFLEVIGNYRAWIFSLVYFLWITGLYSFGLWMPSLMKELSSKGIGTVGWLTAIPFVLAAVSMYINASWADKHKEKRAFFIAIPLAIGGIALVLQHVMGGSLAMNLVFLIIAGIGIYAAFGPWWAWAMSFFPNNQAGTLNGLINLCGNFGGIVGPIIVGAVAQGKNLLEGFYVLGFFLILGAIIVFSFNAVWKSKNSKQNAHPTAKQISIK